VTDTALLIAMAPREGANGTFVFLLNVTMIIMIFYFFLIRPQRKEAERHEQMITALEKGDEIVTAGGIVGTVIRVEEHTFIIKTAQDTRLTLEKSKVARKLVAKQEQE